MLILVFIIGVHAPITGICISPLIVSRKANARVYLTLIFTNDIVLLALSTLTILH